MSHQKEWPYLLQNIPLKCCKKLFQLRSLLGRNSATQVLLKDKDASLVEHMLVILQQSENDFE